MDLDGNDSKNLKLPISYLHEFTENGKGDVLSRGENVEEGREEGRVECSGTGGAKSVKRVRERKSTKSSVASRSDPKKAGFSL